MNRYFILVFIVFLVSCSSQKKLQKTYVGKPQTILSAKFGYPKATFDQGDEKVLVYEIVKDLESTEIQQAKLTLDPIVSPMVQKTERYYFTIRDSVIVKVKKEEEYQR